MDAVVASGEVRCTENAEVAVERFRARSRRPLCEILLEVCRCESRVVSSSAFCAENGGFSERCNQSNLVDGIASSEKLRVVTGCGVHLCSRPIIQFCGRLIAGKIWHSHLRS